MPRGEGGCQTIGKVRSPFGPSTHSGQALQRVQESLAQGERSGGLTMLEKPDQSTVRVVLGSIDRSW